MFDADLKRQAIAFLTSSILALFGGCLMGCSTMKENNGKNFVSWGTRVEWGQETAETKAIARSEIDAQPLMDFFLKIREDEGESDGD